jgi:hypothetical protein
LEHLSFLTVGRRLAVLTPPARASIHQVENIPKGLKEKGLS